MAPSIDVAGDECPPDGSVRTYTGPSTGPRAGGGESDGEETETEDEDE